MEITVGTSAPYRILIERGCLGQAGKYAAEHFEKGTRAAIVCDSNILPLYAHAVKRSLCEAGCPAEEVSFSAGEESKGFSTLETLYRAFAEMGLTRSDFVVALGGGVTGDMAGFAAATYLRGIRFVQIPTSLLAQIDSSVGGKTAVDLPQGKNLVGAFHQPRLVLIDPDVLATLPPRFFSDGMGEAIKYGCIRSRELFDSIAGTDVRRNPAALERMIYRCVDIKREVVEHDEFDNGERMLLNFGHTFGHALEKFYHYKRLSHGEAVGIGMVMMARLGEAWGMTESGTADAIAGALKSYGLPTEDTAPLRELVKATTLDKKSRGDSITLILLKRIGESFLYRVPREKFEKLIKMAETRQ